MDPKRGSRRIGFKTGGAAKARARVGTTRNGLFSKLFKRKPIAESTESKPAASKPAASKPATSKPVGQTNRSGGNRSGSAGSKKNQVKTPKTPKTISAKDRVAGREKNATSGRSEQMMANSAGNKGSSTSAEVKAWKARKPDSRKPDSWKGFDNVGAALNAWRKEDPRKK